MSNQSGKGKYKVLDSISMLVETQQIDKDKYLSKSCYHDSMVAIASSQGVDLLKVKAGDAFVAQVKETQNKYQALHQEYQYNLSDPFLALAIHGTCLYMSTENIICI